MLASRDVGDARHHIETVNHELEDSVSAVEVGRRSNGDKKLGCVGLGPVVGYRKHARTVEAERGNDFIFEWNNGLEIATQHQFDLTSTRCMAAKLDTSLTVS